MTITFEDKEGKRFELTREQIQDKFGFTFSDSIIVDGKPINPHLGKSFNIEDHLTIKEMENPVGHGIFAKKDIPAKTAICLYAGEFRQGAHGNGLYAIRSENSAAKDVHCEVDAGNFGNLSRFVQHMPDDENMKDYEFTTPNATQLVATANIDFVGTKINLGDKKITACCLVSMKDIKKGQQLGVDYGKQYWSGLRQTPLLFNKIGKILPREYYREKTIHINNSLKGTNKTFRNEFTREFLLGQINEQNCNYTFSLLETELGKKEFFVTDLSAILSKAENGKAAYIDNEPLSLEEFYNEIDKDIMNGDLLLKSENYDEALSIYQKASNKLSAIPRDYFTNNGQDNEISKCEGRLAKVYFNISYIYMKKGIFDIAIRCFNKTIQIAKKYDATNCLQCLYNIAYCYTSLRKYDIAIKLYENICINVDNLLDKCTKEENKKSLPEIKAESLKRKQEIHKINNDATKKIQLLYRNYRKRAQIKQTNGREKDQKQVSEQSHIVIIQQPSTSPLH